MLLQGMCKHVTAMYQMWFICGHVWLLLCPQFVYTGKLLEEVERLRDSVMREMQLGVRDKLNHIIHTGTLYPL